MPAPFVAMQVQLNGTACNIDHLPSKAHIRTTPPADNGGLGDGFSPTDLLAASLGSCAITTMALIAQREGIPFGNARANVEKYMSASPRRVQTLKVLISMPREVKVEHRSRLEDIAHNCPVAKSLHPDVKIDLQFQYA